MIALYFSMCTFYVFWGCVNGLIWGRKGADSFKLDEHWFIVLLELSVILIVLGVTEFELNKWDVRVAVFSSFLSKPFFKDGAMYYTRDLIDGSYPARWMANPSKTSTALLNFTVFWRIMGLLAGLMLLWYAKLN
jgi:hypothetical protein